MQDLAKNFQLLQTEVSLQKYIKKILLYKLAKQLTKYEAI